jgi:hypothetical protein
MSQLRKLFHLEAIQLAGSITQRLAGTRSEPTDVLTSILLQQVRASDSSATWDGVRKCMTTENAMAGTTGGRNQNTLAQGIAHGGFRARS